jgi:hypothetical protein
MPAFACAICKKSRLPWRPLCRDCGRLFAIVQDSVGKVGFSELIDALLATGLPKERVQTFLTTPSGTRGSVLDQITAALTNNLAEGMGVKEGSMLAEDVRRIRENPLGLASSKPLGK